MAESHAQKKFKLEFSNRVIEHLGIKLYQNKPTNVVAEFLSNAWDADAGHVHIRVKARGLDGTPTVSITDDGRGMTREELTDEFLVIGRNRRSSPTQRSPGGRAVMGRKGIGKLAGFGIAGNLEVISVPNPKCRAGLDLSERKFYWLRFSLQDLIARANVAQQSSYEPEVLADGVDLASMRELVARNEEKDEYEQLLKNVEDGGGGVLVLLKNTTLKRAMNVDTLLQSMGRRFTVSMLRPDFVVTINGKTVAPEDALPKLHPFGFGDWTEPREATLTISGIERKLRYWVKFVDLEDSDWSIENAGIGVYAHGKIAQDRPFFFDVKGKEIWSRYVYGVVEADWLDELSRDVVSTDRRSIDWDTDETSALHSWGNSHIATWLDEFRKWRASQRKVAVVTRIRNVTPDSSLTGAEEEALADLLSEVLAGLANDEDAKNRATKGFTEAWTHAPTRALTQALWQKVFSAMNAEPSVFAELVDGLRKSMVPEAMGLAVTMSQRIAAITTMSKMIEESKTETHLQKLVETFPWLLGPRWERLVANKSIKTLIEKHPTTTQWTLSKENQQKRPDFVFLSDPGGREELIVFELKGPEAGKTLQPDEYEQLVQYLNIIRGIYTDRAIAVRGVLVGHDKGGFEAYDTRIDVRTWNEVLMEARSLHAEYLQALLAASDPNANDARLQQIADFGGQETMALLERLAPIGDYPDIIKETLSLFRPTHAIASTVALPEQGAP